MNGQMDWAELFFSSTGRLGRTPFVVAGAALFATAYLYLWVTPELLQFLTGWIVYPGLLFIGCCLLSKRLHDRGRSGWWAALVIVAAGMNSMALVAALSGVAVFAAGLAALQDAQTGALLFLAAGLLGLSRPQLLRSTSKAWRGTAVP